MDDKLLEQQLAELPLYHCFWLDPKKLEFSERVRWICRNECSQYGKTWACPPAVGTVEECRKRIGQYEKCLVIATVSEVEDISDIAATLATRPGHEAVTDQVADLLRAQRITPFILSTEACAVCQSCTFADGLPCRFPEKMHPCVESHGINVIPILEENGLEFQYGGNVVTWVSLLLFSQ